MLPDKFTTKYEDKIEKVGDMTSGDDDVRNHIAAQWFPGKDVDGRIAVDRNSGSVYLHINLGVRGNPYPKVHLIVDPKKRMVSIDGHDLYSRVDFLNYGRQPFIAGMGLGPNPAEYGELSDYLTRKLMVYSEKYDLDARALHWGSRTAAQKFRFLEGVSPEGPEYSFQAFNVEALKQRLAEFEYTHKPSLEDVKAFEEYIDKVAHSKEYGSVMPKELYDIEGGLPYSVVPYGKIFMDSLRLNLKWSHT